MRRITLALLCTFAFLASPALAHEPDVVDWGPDGGDWEITLSGTGNNNKDFDAGGFGVAGSLGFFFTDWLEIAVRNNTVFFDTDQMDANWTGTTRGALDFHIPLGPVYPFVGGNVGVRYGDGDIETVGTAAPEVGVKFFVREKTFLMAMGEYQFFFDDIEDADDSFDNGQFVYTVGIGFNF